MKTLSKLSPNGIMKLKLMKPKKCSLVYIKKMRESKEYCREDHLLMLALQY